MSEFALSQIMQAIDRMIMIATVIERDGDRVRVSWADGAPSDWLALAQLGSKNQQFWIPQNAGDQVLVLSPGGDTTKGIVYPGPFAGPAPAGNFNGVFSGAGDVIASGVSLVSHAHAGDGSGAGDTGPPL